MTYQLCFVCLQAKHQPTKKSQHFIFNNGTEVESLDPALITGVPESRVVSALFEGLVTLDPKTLKPQPGVAERWEISTDGLEYTFYLRKEAIWSDGIPVTAKDFYNSWKRVLTPKIGSAYAYQLFPIAGAEDYYRGKESSFERVGIQVIDSHSLRVTLHFPCHYFLDIVAFHTLFPVRVDCIEQHQDRWVMPKNIISNGAFQLDRWKPRQYITLKKNPTYWNQKNCKLQKVTIYPYDDLDTAYKLFLEHKIHWLPAIPLTRLDTIQRHPDYYVMPYMGSYFYRFNTTKPPFDDVRVRKAFSLAINRQDLTDHVLKAGQAPATWFCPSIGNYQPIKGLESNPQQARKLLKEAGYGPGKAFPKVEFSYNTSESHKRVAEVIIQQWKKHLGITVSLRNMEWKVLLHSMSTSDYQIIRSSWIGDYGDPNTFFDLFVTDGGNNRTGWSNAMYDQLLYQSQWERNEEKRLHIFQKMERILVENEFPIIPLYMYVNQGLISESIQGWYENIRGVHPLEYIWLEN